MCLMILMLSMMTMKLWIVVKVQFMIWNKDIVKDMTEADIAVIVNIIEPMVK